MTPGRPDPLTRLSPATRAWFAQTFAVPTPAQVGAWEAVASGRHALVVAPTGSGKTLAAFLWALDALHAAPPPGTGDADPALACRVLYVSPLKALAADVERNLRTPLVGIRHAADRLGVPVRDVRVGVRTGDTPPAQRRAFATRPPDILVTTPESLYLILTSRARAGLAGVGTVIVDEVHALAGTKRGAHLALSLERLDALVADRTGPVQRIGLSATVRPVDVVAGWLAGARPRADGGREVVVVQPPVDKAIEVEVVVPVPDLTDLTGLTDPAAPGGPVPHGPDGGTEPAGVGPRRASVWPHVEERVVDLVTAHRSTLVFTNSRRSAERLTTRINELWAQRRGDGFADPGSLQPAQVLAQSGVAVGVDTRHPEGILARAHHGSMSRAERTRTESELKAGLLPAVVATSSLELGIDMGAIDLVVQVGAPPSVASGLQRVGRSGHQVGAVSHGVVLPTFRGELVPAAVTAERMRAGQLEALHVPANPLDVLAQQVVAMVAVEDWSVAQLARVVRRAAPFAELGEATWYAVLDMLAGRYPSEEFAELRPRLVWDRARDVLHARPGALRLAVTSGGTIPDRGTYGVYLAGSAAHVAGVATDPAPAGGGRRVGELDEEMVYESRVGDTFTLGSSTWRIEEITPDRVLVSPAPGVPGRLPFWKGDSPGRPAPLGRAVGAWVRELAALTPVRARARLAATGLDAWAADNLLAYLAEQRAATGALPTDTTVVVEQFRDELGDWRVVVHSPYGAQVHAPWALVLVQRLHERFGLDAAALHSDDGIVLRLPDVLEPGAQPGAPGAGPGLMAADLLIDPADVQTAVRAGLAGSTLFAARFREAAARALLLPRRRPDRRTPLWQQRQRSAQLLQVASRYPDFPILLEAARECLRDDFDVPALTDLMGRLTTGQVRVVQVTTAAPSPFAQSLLFGYTAQFLYDGDAPLAERRAAALTLDPTLLAELLGGQAPPVADLLDPTQVVRTEAELARLAPERQVRDAEALADLLRTHGPLTAAEAAVRTRPDQREQVAGWLAALAGDGRALRVRLPGVAPDRAEQWAAVEDTGRLRDALGAAVPVTMPEAFGAPVADPLGDLVRRYARTHGPFAARDVAMQLGLGRAVVAEVADRLVRDGALVAGPLRPDVLGGVGEEYCDVDVLRTLRRRSLAALRAEVEPVPQRALGAFLPSWQGVGAPGEPDHGSPGRRGGSSAPRGPAALLRAVEQLAGVPLPLSALEGLVLPARVGDYSPGMLDELVGAGQVVWAAHGELSGHDALVSLHPADVADLTLPWVDDAAVPTGTAHRAVLSALADGGAYFLGGLVARVHADTAPVPAGGAGAPEPGARATDLTTVTAAVWDLVWAGLVTNDRLAPLRARGPGHQPRPRSMSVGHGRRALAVGRPGRGSVAGDGGGRWSLLPAREPDPTVRAHALALQLLDRHGVLTRAVAASEGVPGGFAAVYRVLSALEQSGRARRGYFVEHLGGSQFALPGAVDELRRVARDIADLPGPGTDVGPSTSHGLGSRPRTLVLAATDPANPYGAALAWPHPADGTAPVSHRPGRKAGAAVVLVDGALVIFVERGGRSLLTFGADRALLDRGAAGFADAVRAGWLGRPTVAHVDGQDVLGATADRPLVAALLSHGFTVTPRGLRLRGGV